MLYKCSIQSHLRNTEQYSENEKNRAATVTALDSAVGDIMEAVRAGGLEEETLVLFSSDNGGAGSKYNKPLRGRKEFLYEGGARVVSLLSGPGAPAPGTTFPGMIHVTDWFATFLSLAGGS